jgi:hypothetical protein
VLVAPFNWKRASVAAAMCNGVGGDGAQLAFHVTAGHDDTHTLTRVLGELRHSWAARRPRYCGTVSQPIAAARCGPG